MAGRTRAVLSGGAQEALSRGVAGSRYTYLPWVDLICAGVPCQDWSVAGQRKGLSGTRSSLVYQFARILHTLRPTWFLFENVPGLLSSNDGRDFAEVLRLFMVKCGYGIQWRVLDSQFFGVAQRRRRLFIVGRFGKPCPPEILFEPESSAGNFAAGQETWSGVAAPLTSGIGITGNAPGRGREDDINLAVALRDERGRCNDGRILTDCTHTLHAAKGPSEQQIIAHAVAATLTSRFTPNGHGAAGTRVEDIPNLVLDHADEQRNGLQGIRGEGDTANHGGGPESRESRRGCDSDLVLGRQPANGHSRLLHAGERPDDARETAFCLRVDHGGIGQGHNTTYAFTEICGSIKSHKEGGVRLDAEECADGFIVNGGAPPDSDRVRDFTGLPKGMDSPRYRALGNAVTVDVIEWIGKRIVEATLKENQ